MKLEDKLFVGGMILGTVIGYMGSEIGNDYVKNTGYAIFLGSAVMPIITTLTTKNRRGENGK